jgi:prepilin-type N-terminal cleavage/methylation domain-containing protein
LLIYIKIIMKKNFKKGFTLIELLVVIAIIGILSSVVLASLNTARNKGADAAIKSSVNNARAQAELYYDTNQPNSYAAVCTATSGVANMSVGASNAGSASVTCGDKSTGWAMSAQLKSSTDYFCVDSSGLSTTTSSLTIVNGPSSSDVSCN